MLLLLSRSRTRTRYKRRELRIFDGWVKSKPQDSIDEYFKHRLS